jgi:F0F1-type ATP synthase assembly protein I
VAVQALACASACLFLIGVQETIDGIGGSHTGGFILFAAFTIGMLIVDRFGRKQLFVLCPPDQAAVLARKTTRHSIAVLVVVTIFFIVQTELNSPSGRAPGGKYVVIAVMLCMAGAFLFRFYFPEGVRARETR